ncbi:MAG: hypothetical protein P8Y53_18590 [Pseudolabrys sp.]
MTSAKSAAAENEDSSAQIAPQPSDEIRTFVAAISTVLRETVGAFESTVSRITEITVTRSGRADRDLVVALQDFDRLRQEFATLGEVLARLSAKSDRGDDGEQDVISAISIADLKDRLALQLRIVTGDLPEPDGAEAEF